MPQAGYCSICGAHVYLKTDGGCPNGHPPDRISGAYEAQAPAPVSQERRPPESSRSSLFVGALIGSGVGALLLMLTDFGGWYSYDSYYGIETWGYIGIHSPTTLIGVFFFALPFIYCSYVSLKGARDPNALTRRTVHGAFVVSVVGVVLILLAAVVFVIAVSEADDWWFDAGFYGSLIGGLLTVVFLLTAKRQYETSPQAPEQRYPATQASSPQTQQQTYGPQYHGPPASQVPPQQPDVQMPASPPQQPATGVRNCPGCGAVSDPDARFCRRCGRPVG